MSRDISKEDMETNRSASQHNEVMTKRNTDVGVDEEKKKSARIAPIVIPCALTDTHDNENNTVNPENEPKIDTIRQKLETTELTTNDRTMQSRNVLVTSRPKSGVLKVR